MSSPQKQKSIHSFRGPWDQKPPVLTWGAGAFRGCPTATLERTGLSWARDRDRDKDRHRTGGEGRTILMGKSGASALGAGPGSPLLLALPQLWGTFLPLSRDQEQCTLGAMGTDPPGPGPGEPSSQAVHQLLTSRLRALAPQPRNMFGAHTLTPRFVYPGSCVSCLAKPHRRLSPDRHKPTTTPAKHLTAPPATRVPAAHSPALLTSSHLMKRSPWLR